MSSTVKNKKDESTKDVVPNLEDKINVFANLILDRIADDLKNNCLKIPLKS